MNILAYASRLRSRLHHRMAAGSITMLLMTAPLLALAAAAQPSTHPDTSQTRPLKYLMVSLGQDMNRINDGLWHGDFEMVRVGARAIADHARVPPEQMAAIKDALGARFQQFVGFDQQVHRTAVEMTHAARREDVGSILDAYRDLQIGCTSCHAAFRDEVRAGLYREP